MAETTVAAPSYTRRLVAEVFGTFLLVFGVIGAAIYYNGEAKPLVVGLAVGIAVLAGAYSVGHISGGHFNPAVSLGVAAAGRMPWKDVLPYIGAQLVGGLLATLIHFVIALSTGAAVDAVSTTFAGVSNGYGEALVPVLLVEIVITAIFVLVILSVTADGSTTAGFAPIAIGLTLALFHFIAIPIDNASLNPARSLATAVFGGGEPLSELWLFFVAPIVGALLAGFIWKPLFGRKG